VEALSGSVDRSAPVVISCSHASTSTSATAASASVWRPPNPPLLEPDPEPERFDLSLDWFGEMLLDFGPVTRVGLLMSSEPCVLPLLPALAPKEWFLISADEEGADKTDCEGDSRSDEEYAFSCIIESPTRFKLERCGSLVGRRRAADDDDDEEDESCDRGVDTEDGETEEDSKSVASPPSVGVDAVLCMRSSVTKMCFAFDWRLIDEGSDASGDRIEVGAEAKADGERSGADDEYEDEGEAAEAPDESGRGGGEASGSGSAVVCWWCW
jgi:hypothetical protein